MLFGRRRSISQMTTNRGARVNPLPVKLGRTTLPPVAVRTQSGLSHLPNDHQTKDLYMAPTMVPPAKAARVAERVRHHLIALHRDDDEDAK